MVSSSDTLSIASEDWTPWLIKAPTIIQALGFCMGMAATKEASQIVLPGDLEFSDLASNLTNIADMGQNSFVSANASMTEVASKAEQMGRVGGTVDQLLDRFGDMNADSSTKRLLNMLKKDTDKCSQRGARTCEDFKGWKDTTSLILRSVTSAKTNSTRKATRFDAAINTTTAQRDRVAVDLDVARSKADRRQQAYDEARQAQRATEARLNSTWSHVERASLTVGAGIFGAILGSAVATWQSASAASAVAHAEELAEQQRAIARDLDRGIQHLNIDLRMLQKEEEGLSYLLGAIQQVLQMLSGLVDNINELIMFFDKMNVTIGAMVQEYDARIAGVADHAEQAELTKFDFKDFAEGALMFKYHALAVHALATLYSKVIIEVINPGFMEAISCSHQVGGESKMVVARSMDKLGQYFVGAEAQCRDSSSRARNDLLTRLREVERAQAKRKVRTKTIEVGEERSSRWITRFFKK